MDFNSKKALIEAIKDEVKVLHPLLNHVLRHIDGVTWVEYTHGPNETGADFIVSRHDKALNITNHIGVVVKVGKILQNLDDVSRQVEECQQPRTIRGGMEQVRLTEVWVLNTSSISHGAQNKILEKYRAQKIQFIQGEKLTELVDTHAKYFWYNVPTDVGAYLKDLSSKLSNLDNELSVLKGLNCDDFYVAPDIQEYSKPLYLRHSKPKRPKLVNFQEVVKKNGVTFLEGDMGFGKSKTARSIALHYTAPEIFNQLGIIPVFITFRTYSESRKTLFELLLQETSNYFNINDYPKAEFLFIVDGVDEAIGKSSDWRERLTLAIKEANSDNRYHLVLTSRPLRQLDESVSLYAGTNRYTLRPLSLSKLVNFVEQACASFSVPKRLFEDLQKSDLFKQLPQSPIAAALLSRLISQNTNDLPSNLTELYSKSVENLLGRWDIDKGGCTEKEYKDAESVTLVLAEYIVGNQLPYMNLNEAYQQVENWHKIRNTNVPLSTLKERVFIKSGIFLIEEDNCLLSFRHRSFGEYLYALAMNKKRKNIEPKNSFSSFWVYIQYFYTGLLSDCEEHLHDLLSYTPKNENEAWFKILLMPDYFLAGHQTPYHIVEDNLYKLFIDAANLFNQIKLGNTKTKLVDLPEMHLLWFFQRVLRSCFEYEFFRNAITSTLLKIDQEILPPQIKEVALFFAACYAAELDDASGFEYLIAHHPTEKLQISISFAIRLEQESNKNFTKLAVLKEHEKKLNTLLSIGESRKPVTKIGNSKMLDDLFERPVKSRNFEVQSISIKK